MFRKYIIKYRNMNQQAKAGIWFVICNFLQKGISFITIPIFTRILTAEEYGVTSLYNTWSTILIIFATLNLSGGVYNRGLLEFEEKRYTSAVQSVATVSSLIVFSIVVCFRSWLCKVSGLTDAVLIVMCLHFVVAAGLNLWTVKQRFYYKYKMLVVVTLANTIVSTILGLVAALVSNGNKGIDKVIWSCIGLIIVAAPFYIYNFISGKTFFDKEMWKYSLSFNLPLLPHYLSNLILNQSDRIMINLFCGTAPVAYYSVAYSISSIIRLLTDSLNQTLTPWRYQRMKEKKYFDINKISILVLIGVGIVTIMGSLLAPEIISFFGGKKYSEAIWVVPPVMVSVYFIFLYGIFSNVEFYFLKTKFMTIASSASAILNIILNYIFINIFGYIACAYTSLFCYIVYTFFHYLYMKKICRNELEGIEIFNTSFILVVSVLVIVFTAISMVLYNYIILRISIFLIAVIILLIHRKRIIEQMKIKMEGK